MSDELATAVESAWAYEHLHVNALFGQWAAPVLDAGGVGPGHDVLDVACGTGVVAREALRRVRPTGSVTGLDIGRGMLAVAEDIEPEVTWIEGDACQLPFEDDRFDAVVSQFGLMFFRDRVRAIHEMLRCTKPGGRVVGAVWESLQRSEAYSVAVELLDRLAGPAAADALRAPFVLGDAGELQALFTEAGGLAVAIDTQHGTARFPSVRTMVEAELRGWLPVMGVFLDDDVIEQILTEAESALAAYVTNDGQVVFDAPAHIVTATAR